MPRADSTRSRTPPQPRFRQDLRIHEPGSGSTDSTVEIEDPRTGERYAFDPHSLALFRAFDGVRDCASIAAEFNARFGTQLEVTDVERFRDEALASGLIEAVADHWSAPKGADSLPDDDGPRGDERWTLFNPDPLFLALARTLTPVRLFFRLLVLSLVVLVPLALYTLFENQALMQQDLARIGQSRSYFGRLLFSLVLINLLRCLVQGTLIAYYQGQVHAFGIRLRFGIIPRFFIDKSAIRDFNRSAQLWTWGANLLFRLVLVVAGTVLWFSLRDQGSALATHALVLTHAALISFLLVSLPLRASDGYRWLMTWRRMPLTTMKLALHILGARVRGNPIPTSVDPKRAWRLLLYAVALISFWTWAFIRISSHIAGGLIESFPQLFGEVTEALILLIVVLLMLRWGLRRFDRLRGGSRTIEPDALDHKPQISWPPRLLALALVVLVLALPFPYRPGGALSLLPPEQQVIQAPVSGKVIEVEQRGGDGSLIAAGETIAIMLADTLEQQILSVREQIREQEAALAQRQAQLAQTLAGSRPEMVAEARARAERAREQVRIAEQQLETARTTSHYSDQELERMHSLPKGLISEIEIARSEKQAAVDRLRILEHQTQVVIQRKSLAEAEAQLQLLLNGASEQEIEIARQEVAESEAALRRLRQTLQHAETQLSGTRLRMPFNGYLVDAYLKQKIGLYLSQGDTFATAQAKRRPIVEMVLPESEVAAIRVGASAEIRLLAYPERPFQGEVLSLEPTGTPSAFGQSFKVLIELLKADGVSLKPGMSGYGKIESGYRALYIQLSRPLARFAAIEMWSWVP